METLQLLSSGHGLIEGPVFDPARGLIFTDVTNGGAYCLAANGKISVVVPHRKGMIAQRRARSKMPLVSPQRAT